MASAKKISQKFRAVWILLAIMIILSMLAPLLAGKWY
jgi:hypothetical protein